MAKIDVTKKEVEKFKAMYKQLPTTKCKCCGKNSGVKEITFASFVLLEKLRERYY